MMAGCAPAALKPVATAASIIVEEKGELGALEKTPSPGCRGVSTTSMKTTDAVPKTIVFGTARKSNQNPRV
jgi:hypothetical protein